MEILTLPPMVETGVGIFPTAADMAIVSVDAAGTPGELNSSVLDAYGYSTFALQRLDLTQGYALLHAPKQKPILLVVTVATGDTAANLENNLQHALADSLSLFSGKTVWLPLMGTGSGGLSLEKSYRITMQVLSRLSGKLSRMSTQFLLSFPSTAEGTALQHEINDTKGLPDSPHEESLPNSSPITDLLKRSGKRFFLAKLPEKEKSALQTFLQEGSWETAYDIGNASLLRSIHVHDILILYSPDVKRAHFIRIKALGRVTHNPQDGTRLRVEWQPLANGLNLDNIPYPTRPIVQLDLEELAKVLSRIDRGLWEPLLAPPRLPSLAGLISDTDTGVDHLNITKDIQAFARVMAAKSFRPPLAIALLGKWGSGKSFFMRKLREQVDELPRHDLHQTYCQGIAHIHFNAWSYTDANLWASLVTRIFEGLNAYISEHTVSDDAKQDVEHQLTHQLSIAKEEIAALESQRNSVTEQIGDLNGRKSLLEHELKANIRHIQEKSVWDAVTTADREFNVEEKITDALKDNKDYEGATATLARVLPAEYLENPTKAYAEIRTRGTFLREFFQGENIGRNLVWLALILALIFCLPLLLSLFAIELEQVDFTIPQAGIAFLVTAGAAWKRAEATYARLRPLVTSFWCIKQAYEGSRQEAISRFEQEEKALQLRIDSGKAEVAAVNQQLQQATALQADLQYKIDNALATEALYSFIERRCNSEDYKKHLGIVSTIRKDFEILNGLFVDHADEAEKQREVEAFRKKFKKPLERIILYIDDLDRCQEENVVQVLEAVNLLMAYPLFIVVVGVDPRWVKNALLKKYRLQFSGKQQEETLEGVEVIESSNYLEKIFQIPFHLKEASDESVKGMLQQLAQASPQLPQAATKQKPSLPGATPAATTPAPPQVGTATAPPAEPVTPGATGKQRSPASGDKPEALIITDREIALMQDLSFIIGNNPRAVKRFVNIYRIVKVHEDFNYHSLEEEEILVIFFLLALPIGKYRDLAESFEQFITREKNRNKTLYAFTDPSNDINELAELKQELHARLSDKPSYVSLQQAPISNFYQHNLLVKRFSFKNL